MKVASLMKLMMNLKLKRPDYGVDAPGVIRIIILATIINIGAGECLLTYENHIAVIFANILLFIGRINIVQIIFGILYVKIGKFKHRDRMLSLITWKGNEHVLDVGTGRGLLMIGAAKRLTTGKSVGIDIWKQSDLKNNSYEKAMQNAILEGVADKVDIKNADVQQMPFRTGEFDAVLTNLCIHNISNKAGRVKACKEIARVLKPGGTVIISDIRYSNMYVAALNDEALKILWKRTFILKTFFIPLTVIKAIKENTI